MKNFKKVLALVLVLATLLGLATMASATEYKDADKISADYTEAVKVLDLIETMQGYPNGEFKPTANITREEAAKLIAIFDNKDADISTYYTSINPFADEKGRWGESYVGYGYRAGIIAGMNATTFAPTANVTGTQFLKMALVTLGYDQEAEGFVGSSWAVNVLSLARKLDLIDGLADGWKAEKDLTREEAAQILLNTLKADTVEYAQEAKSANWKPTANKDGVWTFGGKLYLTVAGAVKTGNKLYKDFKLNKEESSDAFYRPYTKWVYDNNKNKTVEVMDTPKATFTTKFSMCDLLVALGVKETDTKTQIAIDAVYCDGHEDVNSAFRNVDASVSDATEILAVADTQYVKPGLNKAASKADQDARAAVAWNHTKSTCQTEKAEAGAQGTLTQVFYVGKDDNNIKHYIVCSIETWLAQVDKVTKKTNARDEHVKADGAVLMTPFFRDSSVQIHENNESYCLAYTGHCASNEFEWTNEDRAGKSYLSFDDPAGLEKDDYVLFTYSFRNDEDYDKGVQSVDLAEGKEGRLNGYKFGTVAKNPSETRVDGEFVKDAVHFHMNYNWSKSNNFGTYTFYYDAYGNVIGMDDSKDTSNWGVLDGAYITYDKGTAVLNVEVVNVADAKVVEGTAKKMFDAEKFNGLTAADIIADALLNSWQHIKDGENRLAFTPAYDHLFKISTDSKGVYTIEEGENVRSLGNLFNTATDVKVVNNKPYVETNNGDVLTLTSKTQILVHKMDDTYASYTGYKNVPSMIAHYAEYVLNDDGAVDVLYLCNDVYMTDGKFIAYVGKSADRAGIEVKEDGDLYFLLTVYVDGEAKEVYVSQKDMETYFDDSAAHHSFTPGFYQLQYTDIEDVTVVKVLKVAADLDNYMKAPQLVQFFDGETLKIDGNVYALDAKCGLHGIYKNKIVDIDSDEIEVGESVYATLNDDDVVTAIYLVLADND